MEFRAAGAGGERDVPSSFKGKTAPLLISGCFPSKKYLIIYIGKTMRSELWFFEGIGWEVACRVVEMF